MEPNRLLAEYLAKLLSETVAFKYIAQGFHWNVKGINFHQYHDFFGEIYEDAEGAIDPTAENIRKLNYDSPFRLQEFVALGDLPAVTSSSDPLQMSLSLYIANEQLRKCVIMAFAYAEEANQQGIMDFLAQRLDMHSKWQWQLRSIIGDATADTYEYSFGEYEVTNGYYMNKAEMAVGDFVRWQSGTGNAQGKITRIVSDGEINVPDSSFSVEGSEDDPALLIRIYEDKGDEWVSTDTQVGHRASTVNRIQPLVKAESFKPPKGVQEEAQRALRWMEEGQAGENFTDVGRRRASQLANGQAVSVETLRRMNSYLARHAGDSKAEGFRPDEEGYPTPGRVAWAAWGGDPAISWVRDTLAGLDKE